MSTDTIEQIQIQAVESARGLVSQGWTSPGREYDLGVYPGDLEALEDRIGRAAAKEERLELERAIRAALDEAEVKLDAVAAVIAKLQERRGAPAEEGSGEGMIDQRVWWERGDAARLEDERSGHVSPTATAEELRDGLDLALYFESDLAPLTDSERVVALEAAEHGYVEGRPGGYGQPSWLDSHAG